MSCVGPQANFLASFLLPMLEFTPERRATAREMLKHPWLDGHMDGNPELPEEWEPQRRPHSPRTDGGGGRRLSQSPSSRSPHRHEGKRSR